MNETMKATNRRTGSPVGFIICVIIGLLFYFSLSAFCGANSILDYNNIIDGIVDSVPKQIVWFFMDFTEAQFYASMFAGIGMIIGGIAAWILALKNSRWAGFDICYGKSTIFPWVLAAQLLSLVLAIFVFRYIGGFADPGVTYVATFLSVVGAPPSVMLVYGPSRPTFLTVTVLGGLICAPIAIWLDNTVVTPLGLPVVVATVTTVAVSGMVIFMVCKILPWVKKVPIKPHRKTPVKQEDVYSTTWFIRRVLANFTDAQYYGNEVASIVLLLGMVIGTIICGNHGALGSGAISAIVLSQFVAGSVGVFLYAHKFENDGWYATFVPVVSAGPACVLTFGATIPVAVFAGVLSGFLGGPVAQFFAEKLPEDMHASIANAISMALCTIVTVVTMNALPWF